MIKATTPLVLSIDQSIRSSGFIIFLGNSIQSFGTIKCPKDIEDPVLQLIWVIKEFTRMIKVFKIEEVTLEGLPFGMQSSSVRILAALFFMMLRVCVEKNIKYTVIPPSEAKKIAINGKASKEEMINALPVDFKKMILDAGFKKTTGLSDITDAYFIYKAYQQRQLKGDSCQR